MNISMFFFRLMCLIAKPESLLKYASEKIFKLDLVRSLPPSVDLFALLQRLQNLQVRVKRIFFSCVALNKSFVSFLILRISDLEKGAYKMFCSTNKKFFLYPRPKLHVIVFLSGFRCIREQPWSSWLQSNHTVTVQQWLSHVLEYFWKSDRHRFRGELIVL